MKAKPAFKTQVFEEATDWFVDFAEGEVDAAGREAFNTWLRTSPEHVRAYLQISAFWDDATLLDKGRKSTADELVARALAESNVVKLTPAATAAAGGMREIRSISYKQLGLAASLAAVLLTGAYLWVQSRPAQYVTEVGEQRSLTLKDGSTVDLNSRSKIAVSFTDDQRIVTLLEGQALFDVAGESRRPFIVRSGSASVRVIGTQFDVYKKASGVIVTVVEGKVAVVPSDSAQSVVLSAGEQLVVTPHTVGAPHRASIAAATAWTRKKLIFESVPLHAVIEEFNRYNPRPLVIDDPKLAQYHISGIFPSSDSARLVTFLRRRFDVTVQESSEAIRITSPDKE